MLLNIGIIGCGNIASQMARALKKVKGAELLAVASRSIDKSKEFADNWGAKKYYGSYEELVKDDDVELIYVATPHSFHYEHARLCLENNKHVLVEKPFTVNQKMARELIKIANEKNLLLQEAMWTRFVPGRKIIEEIIDNNTIGDIKVVEADFSLNICGKERMHNPNLAGGALLDLGIYALTIPALFIKEKCTKIESTCIKYETGVDGTDYIRMEFENGKMARRKTSMIQGENNSGFIYGDKGYIWINNINCLLTIRVFDLKGNEIENRDVTFDENGYEYEVRACIKAIENGKIECEEMTHNDTLEILEWMDLLREQWNLRYPFE